MWNKLDASRWTRNSHYCVVVVVVDEKKRSWRSLLSTLIEASLGRYGKLWDMRSPSPCSLRTAPAWKSLNHPHQGRARSHPLSTRSITFGNLVFFDNFLIYRRHLFACLTDRVSFPIAAKKPLNKSWLTLLYDRDKEKTSIWFLFC